MTNIYDRAAKIFGSDADGVHWPYDVSGIDYTLRRTDPERFKQNLDVLAAKRTLLVEWAEEHGLRASRGCCPRWLHRNSSRRCGYQFKARMDCTWGIDSTWLDHPIWWIKNGKPAVITSAPYHLSDESHGRIRYWESMRPQFAVAHGAGWYGYGTTQVVMWRTDRIKTVTPAEPVA